MEILLLMVVTVVGTAFAISWLSNRHQQTTPANVRKATSKGLRPSYASKLGDKQAESPFWELKSGDMVKFDGTDYFVQYARYCDDRGYKWTEYLLDDRLGSKCWLSVEDDNGIDLGVWGEGLMGDVVGKIGDQTLMLSGLTNLYKLRESGSATYSSPDRDDRGSFKYFQYETDSKEMLAFQCVDSINWDVSIGKRYSPLDFDIFSKDTGKEGA